MKKTIFICGTYGSGKTTISKYLGELLDIEVYKASELIKREIDVDYTIVKNVDNVERNQSILVEQIRIIPENRIILDGHSAIIEKDNNIKAVSLDVFKNINVNLFILCQTTPDILKSRLSARDTTKYDIKLLHDISIMEKEVVINSSFLLNVPIILLDTSKNPEITLQMLKEKLYELRYI